MKQIILIVHNIRSCHNVGSLLRTAEGLGIQKVYLTGYTPYPLSNSDKRLPHLSVKIDKEIAKTALGAEKTIDWSTGEEILSLIPDLQIDGFQVMAVEQAPNSTKLPEFNPANKTVLIVGREVEGIEKEVLNLCDGILEIPMLGQKESFNVAQAAAMAMYHCTFV